MREQGLRARPQRRRRHTTRPGQGRWRAPDLVGRRFAADGLNLSVPETRLTYRVGFQEAARRLDPIFAPGCRPLPGGPTGEGGGRPNAVDRGRRRSSADRCNPVASGVVVPRLGRLDLFPDRSAHVQRAGVSVGSSGSSVHGRITGTRDERGILFVSCLVVPSCHLALLVPARPRCSGHSCLSWRRFGRPRTWLIGFGRGMSPTGTVGAATQPTPTGGSGIPARWCDSRLSLRTSRGTHGPSTPTRMRRTRLPRPAALEERHRGAGGETRGPGLPKMSVDRSEGGARPTASPADDSTRLRPGTGAGPPSPRPAVYRGTRGCREPWRSLRPGSYLKCARTPRV